MSIIDHLLSYIAPHECMSCRAEGALLCSMCSSLYLQAIPSRCFRCHKPSPLSRLCKSCRKGSGLNAVQACVAYEGYAKAMISSLKFKGAQAAAREMATHMKVRLETGEPATYIVPVPTATGRVRRRGYDQAVLLAKELSRQTHIPYISGLQRYGQTHQVGASRNQRLQQLEAAFTANSRIDAIKPGRVVLVDDVVTTGATLEAAAATLRRVGLKHIDAIVFAQA